jgi:pimeloyl-ACP methyl ester carboxylesterase
MSEREILVLVPGLNCTARLFQAQIEALSPTHAVQIADHRRDDSLGGIARRLLAQAPARFALAGLSMGGYVALEVMRQASERVTRLALLDTSARPDTPQASANRQALMELARTGRFEEVHPLLWPRLVHPHRQGDAVLEQVVLGMMQETGPDAFLRQQRAIMERPDSRGLLPKIEVPALVLAGEQDAITPPELAREMAAAIRRASLALIAGSGHLSTLEQPAAVTAALRAWLAVEE